MSKKRVGFYFLLFNLFFFLISSPFIIFYGPFQSLKGFTVNTILTSRHPQVVDFFLSQEKINEIAKRNKQNPIIVEPVIHTKENIIVDNKNHIRIENIEGKYFKGKVMLVKDPSQVKIAVTKEIGTAGQRLSEMVLDNQAIAGINGGGFYDPNAQGNGAFPDGITVQDGIVVHNNTDDVEVNIIGFDNQDRLILKNMNIIQVYANKIQNAVTFNPNLILDNEPLIQGDGGWGIAPRTGIGQKSDGTVIFVVIDGRCLPRLLSPVQAGSLR